MSTIRRMRCALVCATLLALAACAVEDTSEMQAAGGSDPVATRSAPAEPTAGDREYTRLTASWSDEALELCGVGLRDALGTRDLVQGALDGVSDPQSRATAELEDARHWLGEGDAKLDEIRPRLEAGICDPDVTMALNEIWQFYVKAGTSAVQAGQIAGA